jgi:hypothetical protein
MGERVAAAARLWLLLAAAGCAGVEVEPVSGERTAQSLDAAFAPMQDELSVLCDRLEVDLSRELWDRCGYSSNQAFHQLDRQPGPPAVYAFRNERGGVTLPLKFKIGRQTWLVTEAAVFRLHGSGKARFELMAVGNVVVSRTGRQPEPIGELRVEGGRWAAPAR